MGAEPELLSLVDIEASWLQWLGVHKNFSSNTIKAYQSDFLNFKAFLESSLCCNSANIANNSSSTIVVDNANIISAKNSASGARLRGLAPIKVNLDSFLRIDHNHIRSWLAKRKKEEISSRSNARAVSALKNFFKYLKKFHNLENQHILSVEVKVKDKKLPRSITFEEIQEVLLSVEKNSKIEWIALRNIALFQLLYGCGLRISEALNLKVTELQPQYLRILGKGKKERIIPMFPIIYEAIEKYLKACPLSNGGPSDFTNSPNNKDNYIFLNRKGKRLCRTTVASYLQLLRRKFNLSESITPHIFRHSFASHLLKNGVNIRQIQELLGHESLNSTEIYTRLQPDILMEKYNKFHPRNEVSKGQNN